MLDKENESSNHDQDPPETSSTTRFWLALKFLPRLSIQKKLALLEHATIEQLFHAPPEQQVLALSNKQYQALVTPDWPLIDEVINFTQQCGAGIVCYGDQHYPKQLKEIFDPPLVLFVKGDSSLLNRQQIAIVGSRNVSIHGRDTAYKFAKDFAELGVVVTSGLALGVDAFAHQGVVKAKCPTIAVIATGIDQVYPSRHRELAKAIIEQGGAIVSEFLPKTPPKAGHFPKRNRIISGMSLGVIVVEAAMKSGSLITARCALEQDREVFAVPGNIQNPQVKGCHWLIKQGAKLVEEVADIMEEVNFSTENSLNLYRNNSINKEKEVESEKSCAQGLFNDSLLASVGYEITPVDTVVSRSKLPTDVVLTRLTMLELRGLVSAVPGGYLKIK